MHRIVKQLVTLTIVSSSMLAAGTASATPLPCVQRAIDWSNSGTDHDVLVTMVALHEVGIAAYAQQTVASSLCVAPLAIGCLTPDAPVNGLLSNRFSYTESDNGTGGFGTVTAQPFDVAQPLPLTLTQLRSSDSFPSQINSGTTPYDFKATCVGNLVVGNDQYGNHWTLSLQLQTTPAPPR